MKTISNYIDGKLQPALSGKTLDNYEPAVGAVYGTIPDSDERDVAMAVDAAEKAFPAWSLMPAEQRARLLFKLSELIDRDMEKLVRAESIDNGKPLTLARAMDIPRASSNFYYFASAILQFSSEAHAMENTAINYTLRQPIGVVGCISPWNLPLYLFTWKIAPALAAGNCVVAKPSEITPMTAFMLSELAIEAGFPKGVLNIVHGLGPKVGAAITTHPAITAISFTGGTKTGAEIARVAAPVFKKLSLELGGKNPNIIFDDCDYDEMLTQTMRSSFANQGQICLCGSRLLVQRGIYDRFLKDFSARTKKLVVGDPLDESTQQGAIVSQAHMEKILYHIDLAQKEGGRIVTGGHPVKLSGRCTNGWFIEPTIIEGLGAQCRTNQEEIFGPVVTAMPFDTEEEALALANSTSYGLASTVWTRDLQRAHRIGGAIKSGIVWVNCWLLRDLRTPFGGVKNSGVGREAGFEALRFFTETKNVC
ncbi:MAG TPA: aldehyde dehydrogenase, partial [bacterium]|nr:aldehyde dehydrogenase [bacterium]